MFLILSLVFVWSRFFDISVNSSGLLLLYVETYVKGYLLLCSLGVCTYSSGIFLIILDHHFLMLWDIPYEKELGVVF